MILLLPVLLLFPCGLNFVLCSSILGKGGKGRREEGGWQPRWQRDDYGEKPSRYSAMRM